MTPFLKAHKITRINSITLFKSVSILQTKIKFTSIAREFSRKKGVHHDIHLHRFLGVLKVSVQRASMDLRIMAKVFCLLHDPKEKKYINCLPRFFHTDGTVYPRLLSYTLTRGINESEIVIRDKTLERTKV